jgi:hypothetical protein
MPSAVHSDSSKLPEWERPAETTHELPWAKIAVIDLSSFDEPRGKEKLAEELRHAVQEHKVVIARHHLTPFSGSNNRFLQCNRNRLLG